MTVASTAPKPAARNDLSGDRSSPVPCPKGAAAEEIETSVTRGLPVLNPGNVAVVIPAFQAEPWIADVASRAANQVSRVLVVDDGSTDSTLQCASSVGGSVTVERVEDNRGKGAALRRGFRRLLEDEHVAAVISVDADGQHLPEEIPKLLDASNGVDLVLGSRHHLFGGMFWLRRMSNRFSSLGISRAAGCSLGDVQTGFRLYRRGLLEQVPMTEDRFEAESAVVVRAARRGFRIRSTSVELGAIDGRSTSHYRPLVDSLRIALAVLAARSLGR